MNKLKEQMKKLKEKLKGMKKSQIAIIISAILLVVVIIAVVLMLTMCGGKENSRGGENETAGSDSNAAKTTYTVSVKTQGGMIMSGVDVYVYSDDTLADLKNYATTDENGQASFALPESDKYAIVLTSVPKGYNIEKSYAFSGSTAVITLTSSLIKEGDISTTTLGVGDVMYDFTVTTTDGEKLTLSEVLSEKKMVMLNFWYTTCQWCLEEFPVMEEAYQQYKDDIEIIALDPLDDATAVKGFKDGNNLSFPMAACPSSWSNVFGITGYPTSIIIDRYGVICMVEAGAMTSLRPFMSAFDHFTADDYEQKLCDGVASLITNIKPTYTMDTSENIGAAINKGEINVTYRPETEGEDAEYAWPFVIGEKNGDKCIYASNQGIEGSFAIIYADIELKAGQAIGFDYLSSTESINDVMYVLVNEEDIFQISGVSEDNKWKSCYPCVATEDGTYELALCYLKDDSDNDGDDTVYIRNMRVVDAKDIDSETYLPREVATTADGFDYEYVNIVYNEKDGYYHVESANGPLLLADLMGYTQFNEEQSIYELAYNGKIVVDGVNLYEDIVDYCSYASNSNLNGVCTVNYELGELLKKVADVAGFEDNDNEWLKICKYYQAYGTNGKQLTDPIKGLATFSAYEAKLGVGVSTNYFYYDRAIMPRGLYAKFVPSTSGVYRITSNTDSGNDVDAWIFDKNHETLLTYDHDERMYTDSANCSMVYYMEAGKEYYIDIAFWDIYEIGYIRYDIEYLGAQYDLFRLASPGTFTYDSNATGDQMYYVIGGGIKVVLGSDGKYYEDLGVDANGNQKYGSLLYADFTGITSIFDTPLKNMIDKGAFDFTKTESDLYILTIMKNHNNSVEETDKYLKEYWGEDYDAYAETYKLDDIYAGRFHGTGEDLTEEIRTYLGSMDNSGNAERQGCVVVTKRLAEILQKLMDKYTFENVDDSWLKLCYYYDHLGAK